MSNLGTIGYAIAGFGFLVLTALLVTSWQGMQVGARLIAASAVTALWALVLAVESHTDQVPLLVIYFVEVVRDATWLLVLTELAGASAPRILIVTTHVFWLGLLIAGVASPVLIQMGLNLGEPALLVSRAGLALALIGLVLLEQIYRNSTASSRRSLRFFVVGLGAALVYDLFLYSQAELLRGILADAWNARGIINAFTVPLIALAARRNPQWSPITVMTIELTV